jgi:tetratricopeptide (TPR) repeat protein
MMWMHLDANETAEAVNYADILRRQSPDDPRVLRDWLIVSASIPSRREDVIAAAQRLERQAPALARDPKLLKALTWVYLATGASERALHYPDLLRELAADDNQSLREWMEVASTMAEQQEQLGRTAEQLLQQNQYDADTLAFVAHMLLQSGHHYDRAIGLYDQLLDLEPDHPTALLALAQHAKYSGDLIQAMDLLERAQAKAPDDGDIQEEITRIRGDAERLRSAKVGPSLLIVLAITVLPMLLGSVVGRITPRVYLLIAVNASAATVISLVWLFLYPLD